MEFLIGLVVYLALVLFVLYKITPRHEHYHFLPVKRYDERDDETTFFLQCTCGDCVELPQDVVDKIGEQHFTQII